MKRTFFSFLFFCLTALCSGQQLTTVRGIVPGGVGKPVEVYSYLDLFTYTTELLAKGILTKKNTFELTFTITSTGPFKIRIWNQEAELVLEPGKTYDLQVNGLVIQPGKTDEIVPKMMPPLTIVIKDAPRQELNGMLRSLSAMSDDFIEKNHSVLIGKGNRQKADEYRNLLQSSFPETGNLFFANTLFYTIGYMELHSRAWSKDKLVDQYLNSKPVLYQNPAYFEFLTSLFDKHLVAGSGGVKREALKAALGLSDPYTELMQILKQDPLLKNEAIREIVLLMGLFDMQSQAYFNKASCLKVIRQISLNSKFSEHKIMAANLLSLIPVDRL